MGIIERFKGRYNKIFNKCCNNPDIVVASSDMLHKYVIDYINENEGFKYSSVDSSYYGHIIYSYSGEEYISVDSDFSNYVFDDKACLNCGTCFICKDKAIECFLAYHKEKVLEKQRKQQARDICGV